MDSLRTIDAVLKIETPAVPVWRRYNHDGNGQRAHGRPFEGHGVGRGWPLLTGELGDDQRAPIRFTFQWLDSERCEGRDYEVRVTPT